MGIVKATAYPHRYAQQDIAVMEKTEAKLNCFSPQLCFPSVSCMEAAAHEERDKLFIQFSVMPQGYPRQEQRKIAQIIARSLRVKCTFQKPETLGDSHPTIYDHGSYTAAGWYVEDYSVASNWFTLRELSRVLVVLKALSDYRPDGEIQIHYIPERFDISMLMNVCTILEARRPLIEQALGLKEELKITVTEYLTFSVPLDVFHLSTIEACVCLLRQVAWKAMRTKRARMDSYDQMDMSNPKFQMRSWLLRLGFIGDQFASSRRTLLENLSGNGAFFKETSKESAETNRRHEKALMLVADARAQTATAASASGITIRKVQHSKRSIG